MKLKFTILSLALCFAAIAESNPSELEPIHPFYSTPGDGKMKVTAAGNFRVTGDYYVKVGTGLKFFYGICGGNGRRSDFGGYPPHKITIQRKDQNEVVVLTIDFQELQLAATPDIELKEGDSVYAHIVFL